MKHNYLMICVLLLAPASMVNADDQVDFAGTWSGSWNNSVGESGALTMRISEDSGGNFTGQWDDVPVAGKRSNRNTLELHGKKPGRSYSFTATISNETMKMTYIVTRLNSDGSYSGSCSMTRN